MGISLKFDYYYGKEAEQFSFYRIPKALIKDKSFSKLSDSAKLLYGLMLDRMSLSIKNQWCDDKNRVYIIYTLDDIMEDMGCRREKAVKLLAELNSVDGIGLIEKIRRGQGKPDLIYVKNFVRVMEESKLQNDEGVISPEIQKFGNRTFRSSEIELQEVRKSNFKKSENRTSRSSETGLQEVRKSNSNYTDINNTDFSKTDSINLSINADDGLMEDSQSIIEYLIKQIDYDSLCNAHPNSVKQIDEIIQLMADAMLGNSENVRIGGVELPRKTVRFRFEKYNYSIIEYVLDCLEQNTTKVKNIRSYLLTTLYNAPVTMESYYQSEAQYNLYGREQIVSR